LSIVFILFFSGLSRSFIKLAFLSFFLSFSFFFLLCHTHHATPHTTPHPHPHPHHTKNPNPFTCPHMRLLNFCRSLSLSAFVSGSLPIIYLLFFFLFVLPHLNFLFSFLIASLPFSLFFSFFFFLQKKKKIEKGGTGGMNETSKRERKMIKREKENRSWI